MVISILNIDLRGVSDFYSIRNTIENMICQKLSISSFQSLKQEKAKLQTKIIGDLRNDNELMIFIDNKIRLMLTSIGQGSDFIQFPANIRFLYPESNQEYIKMPFNVDTIHCDHWSGAPVDSINAFLYIRKPIRSPSLVHFGFPAERKNELLFYRGSYAEAPNIAYKKLENIPHEGLLQLFSSSTPHCIDRSGNDVSVSIDFRMRNDTHIFRNDLKKRSMEDWAGSRMTSLGVYWKWLESYPTSMSQKIDSELIEAIKIGEDYLNIRKQYVSLHYSQ